MPFCSLLKAHKKAEWNEKCKEAIKKLKGYLATPQILAKLMNGEPLYLYVAVSHTAVNVVLVKEDRSDKKLVFYIRRSLVDAKIRYPAIEKLALAVVTAARKPRPYFQSHTIIVMTTQPLRTFLHNPNQSAKLTKWAIKLSEYDIEYRARICMKSQVLADFLVELPRDERETKFENGVWTLNVDKASAKQGVRVGIHMVSLHGKVIKQSFRLDFTASNNKAEYEALTAGMQLAKACGAKQINAYCDLQLVAIQFSGEHETQDVCMEAYVKVV